MAVDELLAEIQRDFGQLDSINVEINFLQARIDDEFKEIERYQESDDHHDVERIKEHARLLSKNANALNDSVSNVEQDKLMAETRDILLTVIGEGLIEDADTTSRLESILAKVRQATDLKLKLRSTLVDILDEVRNLKTRSQPKT